MAISAKTIEYITKSGDTFDALAIAAYDDEKMASHIIQANPLYMNTLIFDAGIKLIIPIIDTETATATLPPWRR